MNIRRKKPFKLRKYNDGGKVGDLLNYLSNYDSSGQVQVPSTEFISPLQRVVNLPPAEIVTSGDTRVNSMLPERIAKTEGDLAAAYRNLGSQGVDDYLDMTQGVVDAQNKFFEDYIETPMMFFGGPVGGQAAFLNHVLANPEEYNVDDPEGQLNLATALLTAGRAKAPQPVTIAERFAMQGVKDKVREGFRKIFPRKPEITRGPVDPTRAPGSGMGAAAAEEAFLAEGVGEASIARGPGASGSTSIPTRGESPFGKMGERFTEGTGAWRLVKNQPKVNASAYEQQVGTPEAEAYAANLRQAHDEVYFGRYSTERQNVRQSTALMSGSKLENQVDKNGMINVQAVQSLIDKGQVGAADRVAIQQALDDTIDRRKRVELMNSDPEGYFEMTPEERQAKLDAMTVPKISYGELKSNVSYEVDPFEIEQKPVPVDPDGVNVGEDAYQTYGVDELYSNLPGRSPYDQNRTGQVLSDGDGTPIKLGEILNNSRTTFIKSNSPELKNTVPGHFGRDVVAHYRSFKRPDQPDILYISELQADPLQARETTIGGIETRQLSVAGGRRFTPEISTKQQEVAAAMKNMVTDVRSMFDINRRIISDVTSTAKQRFDAFRQLDNMITSSMSFDLSRDFDEVMLAQMMNDSQFADRFGGPSAEGVQSIPLSSRQPTRKSPIQGIRQQMYDMERMLNRMYNEGSRTEMPMEEQIALGQVNKEELEAKLDKLNGEFDKALQNLDAYMNTLAEGYTGELSPIQAKLVKDQDQFIIGKILEAEAAGVSKIRFPTGQTAGKIQQYDDLDEAIADAQQDAEYIQNDIDHNIQEIRQMDLSITKTEGQEGILDWKPSDAAQAIGDMDGETFIEWYEKNGPVDGPRSEEYTKKTAELGRQYAEDFMQGSSMQGLLQRRRMNGASPQEMADYYNANFHRATTAVDRALDNLYGTYLNQRSNAQHVQALQGGGDEAIRGQQGIMAGYERLPKALKKHGLEAFPAKDAFGNTWWEVEIPANLHLNSGEIRAYKIGGRVPMKVKKKKKYKIKKA